MGETSTASLWQLLMETDKNMSETRKAFMALSWLFLLMLAVSSVSTARIAGFHMIGGSQYINTKLVLEELASRGHEVF